MNPLRPGVVLLGALLIVGAAAAGLGRLQVRQDVLALVAEDSPALREASETLAAFGTLDTLLIDLHRPGVERGPLETAADGMVARLQATGDFTDLHFRVTAAQRRALLERFFPRRFGLVDAPASFRAGLEVARRDLMSPAAAALEPIIYRDPPAHRETLLARLEGLGPGMRLDTSAGTLISEDGEHALIIAQPKTPGLAVERARALLAAVHAAAPRGFEVELLGAHVFATAAAAGVKRDVRRTVVATLIGVVLLFGLLFRSPLPVLPILLPVGAGAAVALGLTGWLGTPIHGIVLGFGAVMVGIAVDFGVHLVVHYRARRQVHPQEAERASVAQVLGEIRGSLVLGALTTLLAFAVLAIWGNTALRAFARLAGLGVGAAFLFALLVVPPLLPRLAGVGRARPPRSVPRWAAPVVLLLTAVFAWGLPAVSFDGDLRKLDHQPEHIRAREARFAARYAHPRHPTLVVARGADREQALQRAERATALLQEGKRRADLASFTALTGVMPSRQTYTRRRGAYRPERLRPLLQREAEAAGLNAEVFEPFFVDLKAAPGPPGPGELQGTPLESLSRRLLIEGQGGAQVLAIAHPPEGRKDLSVELVEALEAIPGVAVLSGVGLAQELVRSLRDTVSRLALVSFALVALLLGLYYRRLGPVLYASLPVALAFIWVFGLMGLLGLPFNLISIGALGLVAGLGVDYGIFTTNAALRGDLAGAHASVGLAALTTLLGFAALLLAENPVMWSLGFAVTTGVLAAWLGARVLIGAAWARWGLPERQPLSLRRVILMVQLLAVVALGLTLLLLWLTGGQSANLWQRPLALGLDLAYGAWLVRRLHA